MSLDLSSVLAPLLAHHFGGGVYIKETVIPAGSVLVQHVHVYDHLSYLVSGKVEVMVEGTRKTVVAPACLEIAAGKAHGVKALEDARWLCIHASSDADDEKLVVRSAEGYDEMNRIAEALR